MKDCVSLLESDVEGDLQDWVVEPMVEVVRLQDVALRRRAAAGVLGQVDIGEADLPEVSATFLLLKNKTDENDVSFFTIWHICWFAIRWHRYIWIQTDNLPHWTSLGGVITLGLSKTDNFNRMITLIRHMLKIMSKLGLGQFDHTNRMITLTAIAFRGCIILIFINVLHCSSIPTPTISLSVSTSSSFSFFRIFVVCAKHWLIFPISCGKLATFYN